MTNDTNSSPEVTEIPVWHGFAVAVDDQLLIDTVMPTRRGAIVNFLWVHCRHEVFHDTTDHMIESYFEMWRQKAFDEGKDIYVADVTIGKTEDELRAEGFVAQGEEEAA